jgi:hypothetical protein
MKKITTWALLFMLTTAGIAKTPEFKKMRAWEYLEKQCELGPRNPGSKGHRACAQYLQNMLAQFADQVRTQNFLYQLPGTTQSLTGINIIGKFQPQHSRRVLLCAHWDTRPWADMDPDAKNHQSPVLGANDGGSGVAVLLELAQQFKENPPPYGIDLVFFDAEDAGRYQDNQSWAIGSRAYARQLRVAERPDFGILLDMIGDADLAIYREVNSQQSAPTLVDYVWNVAAELGVTEFKPQLRYEVFDDHLNLLEAGIPCIDIIDFDYPPWHTLEDVPARCSPESLEKVGKVILEVIYRGEF